MREAPSNTRGHLGRVRVVEVPTALDNGQRSPRKLLRKVVALLLAALARPKRG